MMSELVFVYGTLKSGQSNYPLIQDLVRFTMNASIHGKLYDLGPYPAVIPGQASVYGELVAFTDFAEAIRRMDDLEDYYGPGHPSNEYDRLLIAAKTSDGLEHSCYCYFYKDALSVSASGKFLKNGIWPDPSRQ